VVGIHYNSPHNSPTSEGAMPGDFAMSPLAGSPMATGFAPWPGMECVFTPASPQGFSGNPGGFSAVGTPPTASPQPTNNGGPVDVHLENLPPALCRQNFLEAMLEQAGLVDDVVGCEIGEREDTGKAVIHLTSWPGALRCMGHFDGRTWGHEGPPVKATVAQMAEAVGRKSRSGRNSRKIRGNAKQGSNEMTCQMMPKAILAPAAPSSAYLASNLSTSQYMGAPGQNSSSLELHGDGEGSKPRWADFADDDDHECSTSTGTPDEGPGNGSASFSSFAACDTDDGF